MARYFDPQGRAIALGKELGSGGEGAVYEIAGDARRVAKIYHHPTSPEKAEKLRSMAELASIDLTAIASWPLEVLCDGSPDRVRGIVLPRIDNHDEIHKLYSPAHRKIEYPDKDWSFLAHTAMNCCAAFDAIHSKGHVIGDVNQGNVLVSQRGTVFLIDCDSFQVHARGRRFSCDVGVPQFTPPELQGQNFRGLTRTGEPRPLRAGAGDLSPAVDGAASVCRPLSGQRGHAHRAGDRRVSLRLQPATRRSWKWPRRPTRCRSITFRRGWRRCSSGRLAAAASSRTRGPRRPSGTRRCRPNCRNCSAARPIADIATPAGVKQCPWCALMLDGAPNFFMSVTFRAATPALLEVTPALKALWTEIAAVPQPRAVLPPPPRSAAVQPTPPPPALESAQSLATMVGAVALGSLAGDAPACWNGRRSGISACPCSACSRCGGPACSSRRGIGPSAIAARK